MAEPLEFFEAIPHDALSDELWDRSVVCVLLGRLSMHNRAGYHDIDVDCAAVPCVCSTHLKPWRAGWSRMPRWMRLLHKTGELVGETGFEPATCRSQSGCSTGLSHS